MRCDTCGSIATKKNSAKREDFLIPFSCNKCGTIKIDYEPVRDVVILWPYPAPEKSKGGIILVQDKFVGGSLAEELRPDKAVIISFGPGYFDSKKSRFVHMLEFEVGDVVRYNKNVPWKVELENENCDKHSVTLCGMYDIHCIEK